MVRRINLRLQGSRRDRYREPVPVTDYTQAYFDGVGNNTIDPDVPSDTKIYFQAHSAGMPNIRIDKVRVMTIPEPATFLFFAFGMGGVFG